MNYGNLFRFGVALGCVLAISTFSSVPPASAASYAYDGTWNLSFATRSGDCDPSYNFTVNISRGFISHPNLVRFQGKVANNGAARASVQVGEKICLRLRQIVEFDRRRTLGRPFGNGPMLGILDGSKKLIVCAEWSSVAGRRRSATNPDDAN